MKKVALLLSVVFFAPLLAIAFLVASSSDANAVVDVVRFNDVFQRKIGEPRHEHNVFPAVKGPATVKVYNGDGSGWLDRATVANVIINGKIIFRASDFNKKVKYLEAKVDLLAGNNSINVNLLGMPGVKIRVEILQKDDQDFPVYFEDPNLETIIRNEINKPETEIIMYSDLQTIRVLQGLSSSEPISSLSGIEFCRNIENIEFNNMDIENLQPLSNLNKLNFLFLNFNRIADISALANLTSLWVLGLDGNNISDISPISNLKNLSFLGLVNNSISDLTPISKLENLTQVNLGNNQISDLNALRGLIKMTYLSLNNNLITDIVPLESLGSLFFISLWANQVIDITPLQYLKNLSIIDLTQNNIISIDALIDNEGLGENDYVYLNDNPLDYISCEESIPELINRKVNVQHTCPN